MGKTSLQGILSDHFSTLRDARNGKPRARDYVFQIGIPISVGIVTSLAGFQFTDINPIVASVSIVSGLLFAVAIFLFQLRLALPDDANLLNEDKTLIDETMSNVLWAILWGFILVFYLALCGSAGWFSSPEVSSTNTLTEVFPPRRPVALTGVAIAATTHFIIVLAMCLKRVRRAYHRIAIGVL